jgi:hypothetical protein
MNDGDSNVVVGIFPTRRQAVAAEHDLRRIGLADQDIDAGAPACGRYRLDVREGASLGSAALDGIIVGTILGAVLGVALLFLAVPGALEHGASAVMLGILMGGFWGSFFGGLGGMAIRAASSDEGGWCEIPAGTDAVLVVARAGAQADTARKAMRRCGAAALVRPKRDMATAETSLSAAMSVPAGREHLSSGEPAASRDALGVGAESSATHFSGDHPAIAGLPVAHQRDQAHAISIPRGAFLLLLIFLIALSALWANVYLRVLWRA